MPGRRRPTRHRRVRRADGARGTGSVESGHVESPAVPPRRRARRHRLLRGTRHLRRGRLDARQGRDPLHVHRRPRSARRRRHRRDPGPGARVRRRDLAPDRLQDRPRRRGPRRPRVRCVPHPLRRQDLLQHHSPRPRGDRHDARAGDEGRRRRHLGRRVDLQGQRHRAVLPLRPARQPPPAHLQAVARRRLRHRARRPLRDVGVARRARLPLPRQRREGVLDRREHLGRDARGEDPRAPRTSRSRPSSRSWACASGTRRSRSPPKTSRSRSSSVARSRSTASSTPIRSSSSTRRTASAAATASA